MLGAALQIAATLTLPPQNVPAIEVRSEGVLRRVTESETRRLARLAAEKGGSRAGSKTCLGLWGHHCRVPD